MENRTLATGSYDKEAGGRQRAELRVGPVLSVVWLISFELTVYHPEALGCSDFTLN